MSVRRKTAALLALLIGIFLTACSISGASSESTDSKGSYDGRSDASPASSSLEDSFYKQDGTVTPLTTQQVQTMQAILLEEWNSESLLDLALSLEQVETLSNQGIFLQLTPEGEMLLDGREVRMCCLILTEEKNLLIVDYVDAEEIYAPSGLMKERLIAAL